MNGPLMTIIAIILIALLIWWFFGSMSSGQKKTQFSTNLTADQEVQPQAIISDGMGSGSGMLVDNVFTYDIMVQESTLTGPITGSHFHHAPKDQSGPIVKDITFGPPDPSGIRRATGTWTSSDQQPLTKELADSLLKGNIYVNVHTDTYSDGEIRGQLMPLLM